MSTAPGHVYKTILRCELCDFTLEKLHSGPNYDKGPRWNPTSNKWGQSRCGNPRCIGYRLVRMVPSLK